MRLTAPSRTGVNGAQLRMELAEALGIPAPYVDIYDDRIEVVGMVDASMQRTVESVVAGHVAEAPPDVPGFLVALMATLGKARTREVLAAYPDIQMALGQPYAYATARDGFAEALGGGFLTTAEHDLIMGQWADHNLPE